MLGDHLLFPRRVQWANSPADPGLWGSVLVKQACQTFYLFEESFYFTRPLIKVNEDTASALVIFYCWNQIRESIKLKENKSFKSICGWHLQGETSRGIFTAIARQGIASSVSHLSLQRKWARAASILVSPQVRSWSMHCKVKTLSAQGWETIQSVQAWGLEVLPTEPMWQSLEWCLIHPSSVQTEHLGLQPVSLNMWALGSVSFYWKST